MIVKKNHIFCLAKFIATCGSLGFIPIAPGTLGSLLAFPLSLGLVHIARYLISFNPFQGLFFNLYKEDIFLIFSIQILVILVLFIVGTFTSHYYSIVANKDDPKEVIIDEVVGQLITINLCWMGYFFIYYSLIGDKLGENLTLWIFLIIMPFILFRFFDIFKPWPINWMDKNIKGGFGIMIDDVMAAFFASTFYYVIIFILLDWFA